MYLIHYGMDLTAIALNVIYSIIKCASCCYHDRSSMLQMCFLKEGFVLFVLKHNRGSKVAWLIFQALENLHAGVCTQICCTL